MYVYVCACMSVCLKKRERNKERENWVCNNSINMMDRWMDGLLGWMDEFYVVLYACIRISRIRTTSR